MKRRHFIALSGLSGLTLLGLKTVQPGKMTQKSPLDLADAADLAPPSLPTTPPRFRFVSVADTGTGDDKQYAVANAMANYLQEHPFKFVILAGDNIYNYGEIAKINAVFEKPYQSLLAQGVKFYACLGNHDIVTNNGDDELQYPNFNMGGRYYTFRQDIVQFFALDTNDNAAWPQQLIWLEQELSRSNAPWKIVFGHHPIYSSGVYGVNQTLIKRLTPLFQKYGVQLYINGHEHHYERTRPIQGTTYLICGTGAKLRPVGHSDWTLYSASQLSFAAYHVYDHQIIIQGIGTESQVFDQGIISLHST